jgi:hypothetical protein
VTLSADIDRSELSVLLDIRHPAACLAFHPAVAFAESLGIDINWLPLTVPTLNPPTQPRPDDDRGTRHRRYRAQAIAREIETYAAAQGLVLRDWYRSGDAGAANLGWLWVRDRRPDRLPSYLAELLRAYWSLDLDPASAERVAVLVDAQHADGASFLDWCAADGRATAASSRCRPSSWGKRSSTAASTCR